MTCSKQPQPIDSLPERGHYPGHWHRRLRSFYNRIFNLLYPVPPWAFVLLSAVTYATVARRKPWFESLIEFPGLFYAAQAISSIALAYFGVFLLRLLLSRLFFGYKGYVFENPKKPSIATKLWVVARGLMLKLTPPKLESCDALLPKLPLPDLRETVLSYMESIAPLTNMSEYEEVEKSARHFLQAEGPVLQRYARVYHCLVDNYVTPFWEKYVYLSGREPLLINSSVAFLDTFKGLGVGQAERAAHQVYTDALNMLAIAKQALRPPGDGLLCAAHYKKVYATSRIPGKATDKLERWHLSRHAVVYSKGCYYKVQLFDYHGDLYDVHQLTKVFTDILDRDDESNEGEEKLAALTTDKRDKWHDNRKEFFLNNPTNRQALHIIESGMAFYSLEDDDYDYDPKNPTLLDRFMSEVLTGNGKNRWADKSFQMSVSRNGRVGGVAEHSVADGSEFDHVLENGFCKSILLKREEELEADQRRYGKKNRPEPLLAERLRFSINEKMAVEINRCYEQYQRARDDLDLVATVFTDFGKGLIKKGSCSPDAFLQMAIQLANYKDQGRFVLTYEATSARFYANSRTETLRTVSAASCAFVKAMTTPGTRPSDRLRLLKVACERHSMRNKLAITGHGIDRHLFVLYVLSRATNTKSAFLEHYVSQPWLLSTSQPPQVINQLPEDTNPDQSHFGGCFGAVARNGYGVCYRFAGNHSICFSVSSYKSAENTNSDRFRRHLIDSLQEMAQLFETNA